jgi:hypothetical protein
LLSIFVLALAIALPVRAFDLFAPNVITPVKMLEKIKLKQDVTLANGPDIYLKLNDLSSKHDHFDDPAPDLKTEASFVWMSNPGEDAKKTNFTFHKGETLLQVIKAVATQRHETEVDQKSYILILGEKHPELQDDYAEASSDVSGALGRWIGANIPPNKTSIQAMPGPAFADFVNAKFRESLALFPGQTDGPFFLKPDPSANTAIGKCNVIGSFSYETLIRAYCQLLNLRYKIAGNTVVMEPSPASAK